LFEPYFITGMADSWMRPFRYSSRVEFRKGKVIKAAEPLQVQVL
jgi:hypothetical protein